jgi:hypothetical protein
MALQQWFPPVDLPKASESDQVAVMSDAVLSQNSELNAFPQKSS